MLQIAAKKKQDDPAIDSPPKADEIEVSVFGRGYGEAILIHATQNNWIVVDSCVHPKSKKAVVLEYLESIGVSPAVSVEAIIATHWHDDHIRGLSEIYKACHSAEFYCSNAINTPDFLTLVENYDKDIMAKDTGIDEFKKIIKLMDSRNKIPKFASENQLLWKKSIGVDDKGNNLVCSIHSLSPSSYAKIAGIIDIKRNLAIPKSPIKRVIATSPNHAAVVLWVSIGSYNILLGSDLENSNNPNSGWCAIVNSSLRPDGLAQCFKIPHHGSESAHNADVWRGMIDTSHVSILTPFINGSVTIPTKKDVERICSFSSESYSTSSVKKKHIKRDKYVEKMITETVKTIHITNSYFGHVRKRISRDNKSTIELFYEASSLNEINV